MPSLSPLPHMVSTSAPPRLPSLTLLMCFLPFPYLIVVLIEHYLLKKIGSDLSFQSQEVKFTYPSTGKHQEFYLVFFCGKTGSRFLY